MKTEIVLNDNVENYHYENPVNMFWYSHNNDKTYLANIIKENNILIAETEDDPYIRLISIKGFVCEVILNDFTNKNKKEIIALSIVEV